MLVAVGDIVYWNPYVRDSHRQLQGAMREWVEKVFHRLVIYKLVVIKTWLFLALFQ